MINLIKAEAYQFKVRRSPKVWLLMSVLLSIAMIVIPYLFESNTGMQASIPSFVIIAAYADFATAMAPYLLLGLTITAFNNDNKHRTIVNSASVGYSRLSLYFSKYIVAFLFALIFLAASFLTFAITIQFFYPTDFQVLFDTIIIDKFLEYLPIWLAYLSLYLSVIFVSDGAMPMTLMMTALVMVPMLLQLGSLTTSIVRDIRPYFLTELNPSVAVPLFGIDNAVHPIAFIYTFGFMFIGLSLFKRKEIR